MLLCAFPHTSDHQSLHVHSALLFPTATATDKASAPNIVYWQNASSKNGDFGADFGPLRPGAEAEGEDGSRPKPQQVQSERGTLRCGHAEHGTKLHEFFYFLTSGIINFQLVTVSNT